MWFNKVISLPVLVFTCTQVLAQPAKIKSEADSVKVISFTGPVGSTYTVPEGKTWHVQSLYCNTGSYNIKVTSVKFKETCLPGEKISMPAWCAEVELFDNNELSKLMYLIKIEERKR